MIKGIIFDLGSVCFNIDWKEIDKEMVEKFGISSLIRSNYGEEINVVYDKAIRGEIGMKDVFTKICEKKGLNIEEVSNYYKELYKKHKSVNEKMMKLIESLKNKFKIACLSDTNDIHFQAHEEQKHLGSFDYIFASFKIGKMKKDEGAFDKMLEEMKLKPEEVVLVDDYDGNIENAKSHGLNAIQYKNYSQLINDLNKLGIVV